MELTINTNSYKCNDHSVIHKKLNKNIGLTPKRLQVKHRKQFLNFNKWFSKEHDYCLPIKKKSKLIKKNNITKEDDKDVERICKTLKSDDESLENLNTVTNLEKINVNNELSSCSLYAINVTTELLKDAILKNQSIAIKNDCINSTESCVPHCNQNDIILRLNNENIKQSSDSEKSCIPRESSPSTLFSPTDIESDMIKLFPTLDFFTEYNINKKLENIESRNIDNTTINGNINKNKEKTLSLPALTSDSVSKLPQTIQMENVINNKCEINTTQLKTPNDLQILSSIDLPNKSNIQLPSEQYINIFNRYQGKSKQHFVEQIEDSGPLLLRDLLCGSKPKTIISPYTHRHLKPYIFRDPVTKPLWLQMLYEIKEYVRKKKRLTKYVEVETIDYSYVRAKHIKSVNALARQFFWPGIDLTESLLYPDFSVIALYKNLVIGFGFMVPDISSNENYLTFLFTRPYWTNCGIARFMIYHLIQTCMSRDITLHVSPNNPAMILYQKFGFKIEEYVQNFYVNYFPTESPMSKHAYFLRLRSTLQRK